MPLARVSLLKGKPPEYRRAILDGLYQAMRETFDVPEDDRFMTIDEYDKSNFLYGENYLGIARDDDLVGAVGGVAQIGLRGVAHDA